MRRRALLKNVGVLWGGSLPVRDFFNFDGSAGSLLDRFKLGVISDEFSQDFEESLKIMKNYGLRWVEIRTLWGTYNTEASPVEIERLKNLLRQNDFKVSVVDTALYKCDLPGTKNVVGEKDAYPLLTAPLEEGVQFTRPKGQSIKMEILVSQPIMSLCDTQIRMKLTPHPPSPRTVRYGASYLGHSPSERASTPIPLSSPTGPGERVASSLCPRTGFGRSRRREPGEGSFQGSLASRDMVYYPSHLSLQQKRLRRNSQSITENVDS